MLKRMGDIRDPNSLSARLRRRRFALFRQLVDELPRPLSLLDVGGDWGFWQREGFAEESGISFTLLNVGKGEVPSNVSAVAVAGNAKRQTAGAEPGRHGGMIRTGYGDALTPANGEDIITERVNFAVSNAAVLEPVQSEFNIGQAPEDANLPLGI